MIFSNAPEPQPHSSRLAQTIGWLLFGICILALVRASMASVVPMHGTGMSPTLQDGDRILLLRGSWGIRRGDIVVYLPSKPTTDIPQENLPNPVSESVSAPAAKEQAGQSAKSSFSNAALVEFDEALQQEDSRLAISSKERPLRLRLGRILAIPGDAVTFQVPDAAMGLAINGIPIRHEDSFLGESEAAVWNSDQDVASAGDISKQLDRNSNRLPSSKNAPAEKPVYEWNGPVHYPIYHDHRSTVWTGMNLPREQWPIEMRATGYLILADNRKDGSCCDARSIGWIPSDQIRGEVSARIRSDPEILNDRSWLGLGRQTFQWLP